jgi:putative spermidine/putrescine transport system permease protein/spermidine/putrescine transport system permease protein
MDTAFQSLDREVIEASSDLGAPNWRTAVEIVLPSVSTSLLAGALFSFVISLNEFYMALFLTTRDTQTLPVLMWLSLRSAGTPRLAVAAVVLLFVVILALALIWLATRKRGRVNPGKV